MPPKRAPPKRAPRIPAPGAERIILTGIMAASDEYGRVRIIILDTGVDGHPDPSAGRLRRLPLGGDSKPYGLSNEQQLPASAEGVRGVCWIAVPEAHKKHWLDTAAALRSQWVRAEALVRRYAFNQNGCHKTGTSLDLVMLAKHPPAST